MPIPQTMQHIAMRGPGGPDVLSWQPAPTPAPGPGEVLIRVQAAGVNRPDIAQREGRYPPPRDASPNLGLEVAGTVAAVGEGAMAWRAGDAVCALVNGGGYAQYCVAPEGQCLPWPRGYTAVRAAALPETFFTVWANVFGLGRLCAGETLLVHGGSSGIGTTAIALAQAFGARVIATAGTAAKCAACEQLGAAAINYRTQDFVTETHRLTDGSGVDVVLDMVAGTYISRNIHCLAANGRLVVIATQGGPGDPEFNILPVMVKRLIVTGSTLRPRSRAEKAALAAELRARVWPLLDAGKCAPIIDAVFPMSEAAAAHRHLEAGGHVGKVVMTVE
jgi:NADPH2:quinone reductase